MSKRDNFVPEKEHAKRIQEELWERYKDVIIAKYKVSTLAETKTYMEKEYNFKASWVISAPVQLIF